MNRCAEIASPQQPQRGCQISNNNPVAIFKLLPDKTLKKIRENAKKADEIISDELHK